MTTSEQATIVEIMRENAHAAHLATCDRGQPMVRPVSPIVEDDLTIWVVTFTSTRKVEQVKTNPKVSLAFVEVPEGNRTAIAIGRAEVIEDPDQKKRVWDLCWFDLSQYFPDGPTSDEFVLIRIRAERIEWRNGPKTDKVFAPNYA